jgi:hypothetical protein
VPNQAASVFDTREDVLTLEPRVSLQNRGHIGARGQHPEDVLHRETPAADDGLSAENRLRAEQVGWGDGPGRLQERATRRLPSMHLRARLIESNMAWPHNGPDESVR